MSSVSRQFGLLSDADPYRRAIERAYDRGVSVSAEIASVRSGETVVQYGHLVGHLTVDPNGVIEIKLTERSRELARTAITSFRMTPYVNGAPAAVASKGGSPRIDEWRCDASLGDGDLNRAVVLYCRSEDADRPAFAWKESR
jgi:hypothetical protein